MSLFRRSAASTRRPWRQSDGRMAADLERFGRHMYDQVERPWPWQSVAEDFLIPMYHCYEAGHDVFLLALADIVGQYGGWAAYGAERLMIEVAGGNLGHPVYGQIMNASLDFLRASGVPPKMVTGYEWEHWLASGGNNESWVRRRPTPTSEQAKISDLSPGETRRLAQLTSDGQSNLFLVRREPSGDYCWIVDARYSDDDPRRTEREQLTARSLHEIYVQIGLSLQVPPYWFDRELEPYFPLPMPAL